MLQKILFTLGMAVVATPTMALPTYTSFLNFDVLVEAESNAGVPLVFSNPMTSLTPNLNGSGVYDANVGGNQSAALTTGANGVSPAGMFNSTLTLFGSAGDGSNDGTSTGQYQGVSSMALDLGGGGTVNVHFDNHYAAAMANTDNAGESAWAQFQIDFIWYTENNGVGSSLVLSTSQMDTGWIADGVDNDIGYSWFNDFSFTNSGIGQLLMYVDLQGSAVADYASTSVGNGCGTLKVCDSNNVPEPSMLAVFGIGMLGLLAARRRQTASDFPV